MLQDAIPRLLSFVPLSLRRAVIGRPDNPNRIATLVHNLLNRLTPCESEPIVCRGPLEGYRVFVDWGRYSGFAYCTWEQCRRWSAKS